ncbi:MAG: xylulokinase [Eubacteriales bacterium]|nr:xylulokinase [Eubacteriales bacterium]
MSEKYLVGIDLGTSGTKTVLFRQDGSVVSSATAEYPMVQPQNGWAEQDPDDWWDAAVSTLNRVLTQSGVNPSEIAGIGISGQMHGLVMLDKDGRPLRSSIIWCDQRTAAECEEITARVGAQRLIEITANPALTGFTAGKILWVRKHQPEIYEKCRHILLPKDYVRYRLTGAYATEVSDASGMQLLDVPKRQWSAEVLEKLEIDPSLLGKVYESCEVTGTVTKDAAEATGLAAGTPVVGGAGDNAAAAVGTGVVADGRAFSTIGTSGVVFAHTDKLSIDPKGRVHTFCCAVPGAWHVMGVTQAAGLSLKWFRDTFCDGERSVAEAMGCDPYVIMTEEASRSPIGANRLFYLPYLMGERTPHLDPDCRGVFFGLSAMHTKRDLIRAVMEGVTYSMNDCLNVLGEMGVRPERLLACGGGGRSAFWRQMLADVMNCPVCTAQSSEGPALGVAILAGAGTGLYSSVKEACDQMIQVNAPQSPNPDSVQAYAKKYEVYRSLYPDMKEAFKRLAN